MKMWSPQNLLFYFCTTLSCVTSAAELIRVSGYEGREVKVSCPYESKYDSYDKYLCRNDCQRNDDVLIKTREAKKNRYSIHDDKQKHIFTVTISNLSRTDAGKYLCMMNIFGRDPSTAEVKLEVVPDSVRPTKVQSYEEGSASFSCPYESKDQNNLKYFCRGKQTSTCLQEALITSDNTQKGQFRLTDDKMSKKFKVTIASLTRSDSGSYLCGVRRNSGLDVFSAVELEVKEWCCVKSNKLSGIVGRPITMQCPYPPQHRNNRKFLCKGDHRKNCTDMVKSQSRFTLQNNISLSSFLVMVTELKAEDAGTYWCGSDSQWSVGNYTKIQLSVGAAPIHVVVYILPAALAVLVILAVQGVEVNMNRIITAEVGEVKCVEPESEKTLNVLKELMASRGCSVYSMGQNKQHNGDFTIGGEM